MSSPEAEMSAQRQFMAEQGFLTDTKPKYSFFVFLSKTLRSSEESAETLTKNVSVSQVFGEFVRVGLWIKSRSWLVAAACYGTEECAFLYLHMNASVFPRLTL